MAGVDFEQGPGGVKLAFLQDGAADDLGRCGFFWLGGFMSDMLGSKAEARKKQKTVEIKEVKLRPNIDVHDYEVKMRSVRRFFEEGDKVKVTLRFRGREMAHQELGHRLLNRVKADLAEIAKVESDARFEGRQIVMIIAPK